VTGCRIVALGGGTGPTHRRLHQNAPLILATSCGWTTDVTQGVEWERHPARAEWLSHPCPLRLGVAS
jgi:hypothetical protein